MECIDTYFKDTPNFLVQHHLSSFDDFIHRIPIIISNQNPITILKNEEGDYFPHKCEIFIGGEDGSLLYFGKPMMYESDGTKSFLYPNTARLQNLTYGFSLHADVVFKITIRDKTPSFRTEKQVFLGMFPLMVQSSMCILHGMPPEVRFNMGECSSDPGGYFIIDGSEKVIICQESKANNIVYVTKKYSDKYYYNAEIRSESEDESKPVRPTSVRLVTPQNESGMTLQQIVVDLPNVRSPIPLFIVMRALGVISDKDIINTCLLSDDENNIEYQTLRELLRPSIYDSGKIYTQSLAITYIASFAKANNAFEVLHILSNYFIPHIGELNFKEKAYFLGYMVKRLLRVASGMDISTDRDSFRYKRIETSGILLSNLFKEYYKQYIKTVDLSIDREHTANKVLYNTDITFPALFTPQAFQDRVVENGIRQGFKGNWGSEAYTKKVGVSQQLNRLSFNSAMSLLRKCVLQFDERAAITGPRLLHSSQWGFIDPVDTPDGGDVGTHKHLAICTRISNGFSKQIIFDFLIKHKIILIKVDESTPQELGILVKLFINGHWYASVLNPQDLVFQFKMARRHNMLPSTASISWIISENCIYIYTDPGRMYRPLYYIEDGQLSYQDGDRDKSWHELTTGSSTPKRLCNIEYVDVDESNTLYITYDRLPTYENTRYTHVEIHGSLLLGMMGNQIIFPEHNQLPRNAFSCGQSKQAVSMYSTNHQNRMDKMGVILNYGQTPLIQSMYKRYIGVKNPYGINAIVAIMSYTGYNTEDAILFNRASLERGLFNTTYYTTYEVEEEWDETNPTIFSLEQGMDENGLIPQYSIVDENTVLIQLKKGDTKTAIYPKKGQLGFVDRTYVTNEIPGKRVAKIRVSEERIPDIGDKFASRAGQKGTCGRVVNEEDMPFTSEGLRPDLIINPHALPSRMTIGQLVESLIGKVHLDKGVFGDCTAFNSPNIDSYKDDLIKMGYHNSGCELLYNGMSGEQVESDIFIGPTYYLRLKHMVKDKINFRERGPMTMITRQPVQGRANDGGLRIGEMERDGLVANGISAFVKDSMMMRGDGTYMDPVTKSRKPYHICVDNSTGLMAIYNEKTKSFISPTLDGPLTYTNGVLDTLPKYKKSFSVLNVPYSFKLLIQELATMNVQMRFITSDTVSHFESMKSTQIDKVVKEIKTEFSKLLNIQPLYLDNQLYVSSDKDNCYNTDMIFKHSHLSDTIFPYLETPDQFKLLRMSAYVINPVSGYIPQYNKSKWDMPIYKDITPSGLTTTLDYFTEKMKTGIFVRIRNNKLFNFIPMYNTEFKNDFYHLLKVNKVTQHSPTFNQELNIFLSKLEHSKNFYNRNYKKWHATNCLLRTETDDRDPTDKYIAEMYDMLVQTCSHRVVNDCIFFINRKDFPHLDGHWKETFSAIYGDCQMTTAWMNKPFFPVLSQCTSSRHADLPIPTGDDWDSITQKYFASYKNNSLTCSNNYMDFDIPKWEDRHFKVVWRGQATGCGNTPETNPRMHLQTLLLDHLDARIVKYTYRTKGHHDKSNYTEIEPPVSITKEESKRLNELTIPMKEQVAFKFNINIEGNSAAYRYGTLFKYGFCVFNVDSEYTLWFEPMLIGDYIKDGDDTSTYHYLKIKRDFSNLKETIEWCVHHDNECKIIAQNGMQFYNKYFSRDFVYDYMSDILNTASSKMPILPEENYEMLKPFKPKTPLKFKTFTSSTSDLSKSIIIIPFRDSQDQNRNEQLQQFITDPAYKNMNIIVVEQMPGQKFNRGMLLNIGYNFICEHVPTIKTFIMHDVDILFPEEFVQSYYGTDKYDIVHLGQAVATEKYNNNPYFMGRVIKFSKESYKAINGFPNTFYGWGGEDDALNYRIYNADYTVYRPQEDKVGLEMKTTNDIFESKDNSRKENAKIENLIADTFQWKIDGINSVQYKVVQHDIIKSNIHKITVQFVPTIKFKPEEPYVPSDMPEFTNEEQYIPIGGEPPDIEVVDLIGGMEIIGGMDTLIKKEEKEIKVVTI